MRGKAAEIMAEHDAEGITPAYAGKRRIVQFHKLGTWDHPRLCGEKLTPLKIYGINWGSPPPMRGKDSKRLILQPSLRITPAYAGKSESWNFHLT